MSAEYTRAWRAEHREYATKESYEKRLARGKAARRRRLEMALRHDPDVQRYREEKQRRAS